MPQQNSTNTTITLPLRSLQKALSVALPAAEKRATNPALGAVRLTPQDGKVEFACTNGTLSVRYMLDAADCKKQEPMLLPATRLEGYARLLDGEPVSIARAGKMKVAVRCGGADTKLALAAQSGFPYIEDAPAASVAVVEHSAMHRMLRNTVFAVSEDKKREEIRGALLEVGGGRIQVVATDGHRMARYSVACDAPDARVLLPEAFLDVLEKTVACCVEGTCAVSVSDASVFARFGKEDGAVTLSHRVLAGKFPDFKAIIPRKAEASLRVSAASLLGAVRRCTSIADPNTNVVKLSMRPTGISLTASDATTGETAEDVAGVGSFQFPGIDASFRGQYLLDALKCLTGDVTISYARVGATLGLWVKHEPVEGEEFEYVLMGVRMGK